MPRILALTPAQATPRSRSLLEGVRKSLGVIPNVLATMAHSPAALQAYLSFGQALATAELGPALREQLALAIAGENRCSYCASAHTHLGRNAGVPEDELGRNVRGDSKEPRVQAAFDFAVAIVAKRGSVDDRDLAAVRAAGFSDAQIVEIVATVAVNIFTNYLNHVAGTEIDFPQVEVPEPVAA